MFTFWHRALMGALILVEIVGLAMAFLGTSALFAPLNDRINEVFFGTAAIATEVAAYQTFAWGVFGGLTVGFAVLGFFIARHAVGRGEVWGWNALALGLAAWYVVDGVVSVYTGAWVNVVSNTLFALPMVIALFGIRPHLSPRRAAAAV